MFYFVPICVSHHSIINSSTKYVRTLMFINPWTYGRCFHSETIQNLLMGFSAKSPVIVKDDFGCKGILNEILTEMNRDDLLSQDLIVALVTKLFSEIIRHADFLNINSNKPIKLVWRVQQYIQENCSEELHIAKIAEKEFISQSYLTHIFKEQTGMSPHQFLSFTRLSKAYTLLHNPELMISEISERCGFISPSNMAQKFREQYGVTPTEFRRQLAKKAKSK